MFRIPEVEPRLLRCHGHFIFQWTVDERELQCEDAVCLSSQAYVVFVIIIVIGCYHCFQNKKNCFQRETTSSSLHATTRNGRRTRLYVFKYV